MTPLNELDLDPLPAAKPCLRWLLPLLLVAIVAFVSKCSYEAGRNTGDTRWQVQAIDRGYGEIINVKGKAEFRWKDSR